MEFLILLITPSLRRKIVIKKKNKMRMHPRYKSRSKQYIITEINGVQEVVFKVTKRSFLEVQWLRMQASTARGKASIAGPGTKILHATQHGQKRNRHVKKIQM